MVLFSLLFTFYPSIHQNIQKRIYEVWGGVLLSKLNVMIIIFFIYYIIIYLFQNCELTHVSYLSRRTKQYAPYPLLNRYLSFVLLCYSQQHNSTIDTIH